MASETFIPNSFQTPNAYIDAFMSYLTAEEFKILIYAARRIFGFQKRQDRISLTQFERGIISKDGLQLDRGTGLSRHTIQRAIDSLIRANLLIRIEPPKKDRTPALYALQMEPDQVDIAFLISRLETRDKHNKNRAKQARARINTGASQTPVRTGAPDAPVQGHPTTPVQGHPTDDNRGTTQPTQKTDNKQQGKTGENNNSDSEISDELSSLFAPLFCFQKGEPTHEQRAFFTELVNQFGITKVRSFLKFHKGKSWAHVINIAKKNPSQIENWEVKQSLAGYLADLEEQEAVTDSGRLKQGLAVIPTGNELRNKYVNDEYAAFINH